jgi:hypothetical protein
MKMPKKREAYDTTEFFTPKPTVSFSLSIPQFLVLNEILNKFGSAIERNNKKVTFTLNEKLAQEVQSIRKGFSDVD